MTQVGFTCKLQVQTTYNKGNKMANAEFIDADEAQLVDYEISDQKLTSADKNINALISALNDSSGTAIVGLYRQNGSGKESLVFLESFAADKYQNDDLLMYIRNSYGSGDYRIQIREDGRLRANKLVSVETPKNVSRETSGESPAVMQAIQTMADQIQRQNAQIQQMLQSKPAENEESFLNKMLVYKQLFDNGPQKSQGMAEILQTVSGLKELGINIGGITTEKEEGFGDMLEKFSPLLMSAMNQPQQPQQPQHQQPHPQYKQNPTQDKKAMFQQMKIKMGISQLLKGASKNADAGFYADMIVDQVGDEVAAQFITSDNAIDQLIKINPKVGDYKDWFVDVGEHVKGILGIEGSKYYSDYNAEDLTPEKNSDIK